MIAAEEFPELAEVLGGTVLPDLRDRFPLGAATRPLGSTGGALGHTHAQPAHTHSVDPPATASGGPSGPNTIGVSLLGLGAAASTAHTHVTDVPSFTSGAGGGDATGSADPPYLALRFIIRAT